MSRINVIEVIERGPPGGGLEQATADTLYAAKAATAQALAEASATQAMLTFNLVFPEDAAYGAVRSESDPGAGVKAANTAALQAAAVAASAANGILIIKGDFWTDDTVNLLCHVNGESGAIHVSDTTITALRVGDATSGVFTQARKIVLPTVWQEGKSALGNGVWGTDTGVELANLTGCEVSIPYVQSFGTTVHVIANGTGTVYNTFRLGHIRNGLVNLFLDPQGGGWINENLWEGGQFSHFSAEGVNISGCRHIKIGSNGVHPVNNNKFVKPSIEGVAPEFHVDLTGTIDIVLDQARWEASPPKVRLDAAINTEVRGGYNADAIVWTILNSPLHQKIMGRTRWWMQYGNTDGGLVLQNQTSNNFPGLTVMDAGATLEDDPATDYRVRIEPNNIKIKAAADAFPKIEIDSANGRINGGNGTADPGINYFRPFADRGWQWAKGFAMWGATVPETQPAANPDTSGATLAELEAEVNALKQVLRSLGIIAT